MNRHLVPVVLVLTGNKVFQDVVWHHLNYYLSEDGKEEEKGSSQAAE